MTAIVPPPARPPAQHLTPALGDDWSTREALAEALIPLVGRLFREHGVITAIYGRSLVNKSTKKILKLHRFARHVDGQSLPIDQTLAIAETLVRLPLGRRRSTSPSSTGSDIPPPPRPGRTSSVTSSPRSSTRASSRPQPTSCSTVSAESAASWRG